METRISNARYRICEGGSRAGVTLIEMLIVVAVIALLATILIGAATRIQNQSNEQLTANTLGLLDGALQEYHDFNGYFPQQTEEDFTKAAEHSELLYDALNSLPDCRKVLEKISDSLIKHKFDSGAVPAVPEIYDPWGTVIDYRYRYIDDNDKDTFPTLTSAGPDRDFSTDEDNITNR